MTMSAKIMGGVVLALFGLGLLAGGSFRELGGYLRASAQTTVEGVKDGLPREVRDRKMENDLAGVRAELVERRVKLNQSARQIEQLRKEVDSQAERAERDRRILAEAAPILEAASRDNRKTVKFASADLSIGDFQREIDDLLARRDRDGKELNIKRDALARLEARQRQADQALADSTRALEAAEREVALLKSRRDHAEIEGRTIALVNAISDSIKAPRESIGESLGRLRDEVTQLETRNEAEQALAPAARPGGQTIAREYDRLQALKSVAAEVKADARPAKAEARPALETTRSVKVTIEP